MVHSHNTNHTHSLFISHLSSPHPLFENPSRRPFGRPPPSHHHSHTKNNTTILTISSRSFFWAITRALTPTLTSNPNQIITSSSPFSCYFLSTLRFSIVLEGRSSFNSIHGFESWPRVTSWWESSGFSFKNITCLWVLVENTFSTRFGIRVSWFGRGWLETESKLSA